MDLEHALEIASEHARDLAVGVKDYPSSRTIVFLADEVKRLQKANTDLLAACREWVRIETDGIRDIDGRKVLALMYSTRAAIARAEGIKP